MPARSRLRLAALACLTIVLGLGSRRYAPALPAVVARYAGDVLWAGLVFWLAALVRPRASSRALGTTAFAMACGVELSQLYHAPWIDALRSTSPGALVLGQGFLWSDLACYLVGVVGALAIDRRGLAHR